jgi:Thioredoxin 2, N-terminal
LPILERGAEASGKKTTTAASITITCPHCGTLNRVPPERHNDEGARCGKCHGSLFPQHASLGCRIVGKWKEDTRVIAAILQDLGEKLREAGFQANFQAAAPKSSAIASGVIVGQFEGQPLHVDLTVSGSGFVEIVRRGVDFSTPKKLDVLSANEGEYEALILDALGIE